MPSLLRVSRGRTTCVRPASCAADRKQGLLIGVTGNTGRAALSGLLASGAASSSLAVLTRNPQSASAQEVSSLGVRLLACDLDQPAKVEAALKGFSWVYCHALSSDGRSADPRELDRARVVAHAAKAAAVPVIYHSSGGRGCGYGISQMEQKHRVEDILSGSVPLVSLQAPMFMEEFWKRYTRPSILQGTFPFSVPGNVPLQLLSAYDLGTVLSMVLARPEAFQGQSIEIAADEQTPLGMCDAFSEVQGRAVQHSCPPAWPFWFLARDVYRISMFLKDCGFKADVEGCQSTFPGLMTFHDFLRVTSWQDVSKTYEQGITYNTARKSLSSVPG